MNEQEKRYQTLFDMQQFNPDELDYSILEKHITKLALLSQVSNSGITVFDMYRRKHVYTSYNFSEIFGYDLDRVETENTGYFDSRIHPEDIIQLSRNGFAATLFLMQGKCDIKHTKLVNEYRILNLSRKYIRVIEQFQVLEFTPSGQVWLSLSLLDISPNTDTLQSVQSKLLNYKTGEIYPLSEFIGQEDCTPNPLSPREKKILQLVRDGLLSKEISDRLTISVHTVNTHRQRILEKLNVDNSIEAVQHASRLGLLE